MRQATEDANGLRKLNDNIGVMIVKGNVDQTPTVGQVVLPWHRSIKE